MDTLPVFRVIDACAPNTAADETTAIIAGNRARAPPLAQLAFAVFLCPSYSPLEAHFLKNFNAAPVTGFFPVAI